MPLWRWVHGIADGAMTERTSESLRETPGEASLNCAVHSRVPSALLQRVYSHLIVQTAF